MQGYKLKGSTHFQFLFDDEMCTASCRRDAMCLDVWGLSQPCLIWLHPGWGVPCGICDCPGTLSWVCECSPIVVGGSVAPVVCVLGLRTARTLNWAVPYIIHLSQKWSATSPNPSCVNSSSLIWLCQILSLHCCTIVEIVPITKPSSSSSLRLLSSVSYWLSASYSPYCSSSELARSLRLYPIAYDISSNGFSGFLVVDLAFSAFLISSCICIIDDSASWTRILATVASLSTYSLIYFTFSLLFKKWISHLFPAENVFLDHDLCSSRNAWTLLASKPLLPSFTWWYHSVDSLVHFPYLPTGSGKRFFFGVLTIVLWVDFVVGRDVGCRKILTTWGQAVSLCQVWYVWSTWTRQNLRFDRHFYGNSDANSQPWPVDWNLFDVRAGGYLETIMTRRPFRQRMSPLYLSNMRFQLSFARIYPCKRTNNIRKTNCKFCEGQKPLHPAAIPCRIPVG